MFPSRSWPPWCHVPPSRINQPSRRARASRPNITTYRRSDSVAPPLSRRVTAPPPPAGLSCIDVEAVVEFEYKAQQHDELTLAVGDIISNIQKNERGWWQGELAGRRGLFPDNFVREIKRVACPITEAKKPNEVSKNNIAAGRDIWMVQKGENVGRGWCVATFSYTPQHKDELELKPGDVIEIMEEVEEGWWEGRLNGKMGMFPSNFTREYVEEAKDQEGRPNTPDSGSGTGVTLSPKTQSKEPECGSLRLLDSGETQPEQLRAPVFGDILRDKHSPCSMNQDGGVEKVQGMTSAEAVGKVKAREFCKGIFSYEAQNEDELSIKEGDIVAIINKECADPGWWQGELQGRQGLFPDNFVRLLVLEEEEEMVKPMKPPPQYSSAAHTKAENKPDDKTIPPDQRESLTQKGEDNVDELKPGVGIQKHDRPAIPPKNPLLLKPTKVLGQPAIDSAKPPQKAEEPPVARIQSAGGTSMPKQGGLDQHIEVEDFDSIVTTSEKLNHLTASRPRVTDRRPRTQGLQHFTASCPDLSDTPKAEEKDEEQRSTSKKASEIRLLLKPKPAMIPPSGAFSSHGPDTKSRSESVSMEELRTQLRDLRGAVELMGKQHKKEIKQLMNELDEEKKIRLSLQMEVAHIKKTLSK
ncbi:SH3 domain-containing kinase-binding protein 1-like isoform X3 [Brienomyrus brachyistius]|uniref:SH3 domain-containing kinase-binding protein 1-like isoform X3 n=1 Tax=Brienomyrus brachyistius TaxID=42636 RepID=UPI0020B3F25B|nr:SH3 domain-containing kinase-binding protein 1-like isoform X3 [Brienomyrus brachyistius]